MQPVSGWGIPEKKENLGSYMTGGHGALPFFNAFMNPFMKDKPKESFPNTPPIRLRSKR
jgi:membrane carboxypeptidase/penicillin-binding protein